MTSIINYDGIADKWHTTNTCDVGNCLCSDFANTNSIRFAGNAIVADIDIIIARGESVTRRIAQGDIVIARGVATERHHPGGRVDAASLVAKERTKTGGRV